MAKIFVAQVKLDTKFRAHIRLIHEGSVMGETRERNLVARWQNHL